MDPYEELIKKLEDHLECTRSRVYGLQALTRNLQFANKEKVEELVLENQLLRARQMQLQDEISHLKQAQQDPGIGRDEWADLSRLAELFFERVQYDNLGWLSTGLILETIGLGLCAYSPLQLAYAKHLFGRLRPFLRTEVWREYAQGHNIPLKRWAER